MSGGNPTDAFEEWFASWWQNRPNQIAKSNAQAAFDAGFNAGMAAATTTPRGVTPQAESETHIFGCHGTDSGATCDCWCHEPESETSR